MVAILFAGLVALFVLHLPSDFLFKPYSVIFFFFLILLELCQSDAALRMNEFLCAVALAHCL